MKITNKKITKTLQWLSKVDSLNVKNFAHVIQTLITVLLIWLSFKFLPQGWDWTMSVIQTLACVANWGSTEAMIKPWMEYPQSLVYRLFGRPDEVMYTQFFHTRPRILSSVMGLCMVIPTIGVGMTGIIWLVVAAGEWVWDIFLQYNWQSTLGIVAGLISISYINRRERKLRQLNKALIEADKRVAESTTQAEHFEKKTEDLVYRVEELKDKLGAKAHEIASYRDQANKQLNELCELKTLYQNQTNRLNAMVYSVETLVRLSFQLRAPHPSTNPRKEVVQKVSHELEILARQHLEADKVDAMLYRLKNPEKAKITAT